jgi:hypothetical protein
VRLIDETRETRPREMHGTHATPMLGCAYLNFIRRAARRPARIDRVAIIRSRTFFRCRLWYSKGSRVGIGDGDCEGDDGGGDEDSDEAKWVHVCRDSLCV